METNDSFCPVFFRRGILAGVLVIFCCASCTDVAGEGPLLPDIPVAGLHDVLQVNTVDMEQDGGKTAGSRAIIDDMTVEGTSIGVYAVGSGLAEYAPLNGINPAAYVYAGGQWVPDGADADHVLRLPSGTTVKAYSWYPAGLAAVYAPSGLSYVTGVEVVAKDDLEAGNQTDYLYSGLSAQALDATSRSIDFTLKHALAKLIFKVRKSSLITEEAKLRKLEILDESGNLQVGTNGGMILGTGTFRGFTGTTAITLEAPDGYEKLIGEEGTATDAPAVACCLAAPAPNVEYLALRLAVLIGGEEQTFLTQRFKVAAPWIQGHEMVFSIKLDGMVADMDGIKVYKWGEFTDTYLPIE